MLRLLSHALTICGQVLSVPIYIVYDALDVDQEAMANYKKQTPFVAHTEYWKVQPANLKTLPYQSLGFERLSSSCALFFPCTQYSGCMFSVEYTRARVHWENTHPTAANTASLLGYQTFQHRSHYDYVTFALGASTVSLRNWEWSVVLSSFLDPEEFSIRYGLYQAALIGTYNACNQLNVVFGIINETGLHQEKAWPVLGVHYAPNKKLSFDCIYPIKFSVQYECTPVCHFGAAYHINRFRKKLYKNNLTSSEGIFEYQDRAIAGNVKLIPWPGSFIQAFYGLSLGNDISLSDSHNKNCTSYPFNSSLFFGGSAKINF